MVTWYSQVDKERMYWRLEIDNKKMLRTADEADKKQRLVGVTSLKSL